MRGRSSAPADSPAFRRAIHIANKYRAPSSCIDRKSTRLNSSHSQISYAVFCLKKKIDVVLNVERLVYDRPIAGEMERAARAREVELEHPANAFEVRAHACGGALRRRVASNLSR